MISEIAILIVDDEAVTRDFLSSYFETVGYKVYSAATAEQAEDILATHAITLLLLDIRMPGKDGLTLTRELRVNSEVGIILVTGSQDEYDRMIGLECGADDFITKPFNVREILARAKNIIRRVTLCQKQLLEQTNSVEGYKTFDEWRLLLSRRQLIDAQDNKVQLTEGEYQLLLCLINSAGHILSRNQILDQIHNREWAPNDRTVDVLIGRLRRKLHDDPASPKLILTVHGAGYLFTAQVKR
ncbi:MAG: response regulator [Oceanospirillaceae bacterium]